MSAVTEQEIQDALDVLAFVGSDDGGGSIKAEHAHRVVERAWADLGALRRRVAELDAGLPAAWAALTDEQRYDLVHGACRGCGSLDTGCHCWNDE